jgi:hypothetical protein
MRLVQQAPDRNGRPYCGSYDNGVGQQNLGMVRAIIGKSNNQQIGTLVLVIRPEYFSAIFNDVALGSGTEIYVLDASNNKLIVRADAPSTNTNDMAEPGLIAKITHNEISGEPSGFVTFEGKRRGRYLAAYTKIPGTTWFVISTIPEKKLTAEAQSVRNQIVLVGISGFLLSIFLAYFISHSISAPLKELVRKMHDTGNDAGAQAEADEEALTAADGQDELGRLARRFDKMREAIKQKIQKINEINASLEWTVIERTAELVTREHESRTLIENSPTRLPATTGTSAAFTPIPPSAPRRGAVSAKHSASAPRRYPVAPMRWLTRKRSAKPFQAGKVVNLSSNGSARMVRNSARISA